MRKHFLDNIRWLCVLFLFPYHTFMVYNNFGESFYVKGPDIQVTSQIISASWPWLMPLLFVIAGVSAAYALQKRTAAAYIKERALRLLIPLIAGILLLVPVQTYFAERFHNGYTGGYLRQYILFFTKPTDLSGYHGGFTPAHLWFLAYLFVISLAAAPLMAAYQKSKKKLPVDKITLPILLPFFLIPGVMQVILDISGKSLGEYLAWFLIGFFLLSADAVQEKLAKHRFLLLGLAAPCMIAAAFVAESLENYNWILYEFLYFFYAWVTILAIFGLGKRYLDFCNRATDYLSGASFPLYVFHQQWIVVTAYFALRWIPGVPLQMAAIILAGLILTLLTYEAFRRFSVTRFLFGIKR